MSGFYDLGPDYLKGYSDDNCYFNNPAWYLPGLDGSVLESLRQCCDDIVAVEEAAILAALRFIHRDVGRMLEPAGAAGIAAILADASRFRGRRIAAIFSGCNLSNELRAQLQGAPA